VESIQKRMQEKMAEIRDLLGLSSDEAIAVL
jgi:hypothetical protein